VIHKFLGSKNKTKRENKFIEESSNGKLLYRQRPIRLIFMVIQGAVRRTKGVESDSCDSRFRAKAKGQLTERG